MATKSEVISWVCSLADRGIGVDADGAYGMQCVD
ncbi:cell wall hydrolase, partial [Bacillus thuringiensis]